MLPLWLIFLAISVQKSMLVSLPEYISALLDKQTIKDKTLCTKLGEHR